jgi:F-type H+-transporting ATPase subunit b
MAKAGLQRIPIASCISSFWPAGCTSLLRKPLSQALGARAKGIEDQLRDLEARKPRRSRNWRNTTRSLRELEKEAENIVAEYVRQGEEAKARILKEAEESRGKA